jgi:hypothetical protein
MIRYIAAVAMGGRLYPLGLADRGPWQPDRLVWYPEEQVRLMSPPHPADPIVTDAEELRRIVAASTLPAVKLFVREDLLPAVRRMRQEPKP